jgi:hypothetical protein
MMSDTKHRIAGITQYVEKWMPTYQEWFGEDRGEIYARRYFIQVICGLAGQKLAKRRFRDGILAIKAAVRFANWRPALLIFGTSRLLRTFLSNAAPRLRAAKRALHCRRRT